MALAWNWPSFLIGLVLALALFYVRGMVRPNAAS
jgi:hypothetical protein